MAMEVAESPDIHKDVKAKMLAGTERSQHFIVPSTMAQAGVDNFAADDFSGGGNRPLNLPLGIMTMLVDESCSQFDLKVLVFEQIDQRRGGDRHISHEFARDL